MIVTRHNHALGEDDVIVGDYKTAPAVEAQDDLDGVYVVLSQAIDAETNIDVFLSADDILAAALAIRQHIEGVTAPLAA